MDAPPITVAPIGAADAARVGGFLHEHLNQNVTAEAWARVITPPWGEVGPNHGYLLLSGDAIVGAYLAVYSERPGVDGPVPVCNLAAFCVLEEYRGHVLRLMRPLLGQKGYDFTDLSPSGNVIALNERLGFTRLDTSTRLVANLPRPRQRGVRVTEAPEALARVLQGRDAQVYADHREAAAARHVLAQSADGYGYLVFRRDRRKGLPLFATPLYAGGDPGVLEAAWPSVASHLLLRHRIPVTLAERRLLGFARGLGTELGNPRPKMIKGSRLDPATLDYLYSELALVEW